MQNENAQGEYYLTDLIEFAVNDKVSVASATTADESEVQGVNDRVQLATLERVYQLRQAEKLMRDGITLADPARIDVRGNLSVASDSYIDVNCIFTGKVTIGKNVSIGANCNITNSIIADNVVILPNCVIEDAEVGTDSKVGPFARLRPGTKLAGKAHIGNFVELKNANVALGSKVNHLSYIGDTDIGETVNIGAGTITCNYDGVNKHRTTIGDNAFIGSCTQLVAPVSVGDNATIGAGSTITKDTPDGMLTLTRAKQITIQSWTRPVKKK
jgi:bifunctional UDP-N-acetylglucosamine pyrophosphorylase/glucosamine-1-phosphate N-acetyltransferase